jgi:sigma-E factor negative regulatory protein RseA
MATVLLASARLSEQQMQEQRERINAFLRDHQLQQRLLQDKQIQE